MLRVVASCSILLWVPGIAWASGGGGSHGPGPLGEMSFLWILPFAGLLLSIALMPMIVPKWWHHNRNQLLVAVAWAAPVGGYLLYHWLTDTGDAHDPTMGYVSGIALKHAILEYVSFIALLASLYIISGGILLKGDLQGKPGVNTAFLAVGAVLANVIGTTGASMLLIRPMLRTNSERKHTWHIPLFFIFLVSNVGGALTPIGDPPLFLGYLRGVDFWWTLVNLWPFWVPTVLILLLMFYILDTFQYRKEAAAEVAHDEAAIEPLGLEGGINFLLLGGVIACVLLLSPTNHADGTFDFRDYYAREIGMAVLAIASVVITRGSIRVRNGFNYGPILEVAALFVGIFIAMIPATKLLEAHGAELGLTSPFGYFWATGSLSAFLDNAPTYVTFAALGCGIDPSCTSAEDLSTLATGDFATVLMAISLGAVFLGAGSYIGNGPNFMVRAIAEDAGYKMPSFFGYCAYAAIFLGPVFLAVSFLGLYVFV